MRTLLLALLITTPLFAAKGKFKDDQMLRDLSSVYWENWNRHDVKALTAMFFDDVTLMTATGKIATGRKDVEKALQEDHESLMKETNGRGEIKSVQFVARNVAVLDEEVEMTGWKNPDGKAVEGLTKLHTVSILIKKSGKWWISVRRAWVLPAPRETAAF